MLFISFLQYSHNNNNYVLNHTIVKLTSFISHDTPSSQSFQNIGIQLMQRATDQVALMSSLVTIFVM